MKAVRLVSEAADELLRETAYYEEKRPGTGRRFREAVMSSVELIQAFPGAGAPGPVGTRRTKVKGFPFTVVYRDTASALVIFAIAPDKRQSGYWMARAHPDDERSRQA